MDGVDRDASVGPLDAEHTYRYRRRPLDLHFVGWGATGVRGTGFRAEAPQWWEVEVDDLSLIVWLEISTGEQSMRCIPRLVDRKKTYPSDRLRCPKVIGLCLVMGNIPHTTVSGT